MSKPRLLCHPLYVQVVEVKGSRLYRDFVYLPRKLYRDDPRWSPPIWMDERNTYRPSNPVLGHSDYRLLLAREGGRTLGRALAYIDRHFNDFYHSQIGFFGSFECAGEFRAAEALFREAESWLRERGMRSVRGPINPVSECWGFLLEGFERPPMFLAPYNPPYYNAFLLRLGYRKVKDLLAYEADAKQGYRIPERFIRFREKLLARRPGLRIRRADMGNLEREAEAIWRISNQAIAGNWGYVPLDRGELVAVFRKLAPIADPDAIWFIEDSGVPVGYCLGFPDINGILREIRGRLLPFGFLKLLRKKSRIQDFRLFGLAVQPAYQSLGLDVLLYMSLFEALYPRNVRLEANYVLEDNARIRNALEKLKLQRTKVYRVYEKQLG